MKPLVSVIIPVYNSLDYIHTCLETLVNQTLGHLEIIVVDDGSTDGSGKVVQQYAEKYNNIQLVEQANAGAAEARNTGLSYAKGEYIGFVDADDRIEHDMFEKLYRKAVEVSADCVICNHTRSRLTEQFEAIDLHIAETNRAKTYVRYIAKHPVLWNKLYKATCIEGLKFDAAMKMGEDLLFNTQAYERVGCLAVITEQLYHYNDCSESLTRTKQRADYKNMIRSYCDDKGIAATGDLAVYQGLVFITGFLFSTVMNKQRYHYVYTELRYLIQQKGWVFDAFLKTDSYRDIAVYDTISWKMYHAYRIIFRLAAMRLTFVAVALTWLLSKVIRMRHLL